MEIFGICRVFQTSNGKNVPELQFYFIRVDIYIQRNHVSWDIWYIKNTLRKSLAEVAGFFPFAIPATKRYSN
jgi:hypothetical protein